MDYATRQLAVKGTLFVGALGLMALIGRDCQTWGFVAPRAWLRFTILPVGAGAHHSHEDQEDAQDTHARPNQAPSLDGAGMRGR